MEKEFVPYELAVKLKQLGFDEECLGYWHPNKYLVLGRDNVWDVKRAPKSPLWQQAFEWLLQDYDYKVSIRSLSISLIYKHKNDSDYKEITDFTKAGLLEKLIEICEKKQLK